jgi:hypothetical protein
MAFTDRADQDFDEDSSRWRVNFRVLPYVRRPNFIDGAGANPALHDRRGGALTYNAIALARRIEALSRVVDNPDPAVKRLARLLATRRDDIVRAFRPYRPPGGPARDALGNTQNALDLAFALNSS